jgi:hypothetical protein
MYQLWFFCPKSNVFFINRFYLPNYTVVVSKNYMYKHYINWACLIVLSMLMFSFISVIVCGLFPWIESFFYIIYCIYIPLASLKYPATSLCLSQARIWFSNVICCCLFFYDQHVELRGYCLLCWYWWNCWPSLFKFSFHIICPILQNYGLPFQTSITTTTWVYLKCSNMLNWIFIVLADWHNSLWIDMSPD